MGLPSAAPGNEGDAKRADYLKSRNRGYQAAFRERCKKDINALTSKIGGAQEQITSAHSRLRSLQDNNKRLLARLDTLDDSLGAIQSYIAATDVAADNVGHSTGGVSSAGTQARTGHPSSVLCAQLHCSTAPEQKVYAENDDREIRIEGSLGFRTVRSIWKKSDGEPDQEASQCMSSEAFACQQEREGCTHHPSAVVSYASVAACAPAESRASAATNSTSHDWFQPSLTAYIHGSASKLSVQPQDVTWVAQFPYPLPGGGFLSTACCLAESKASKHVSTAFSDALSQSTAQKACVVECLLLEAEHEYLEISCAKSTKVSISASHTKSSKLLQDLRDDALRSPAPPKFCGAPNRTVLQALHVSNGVHGTCSLAVAVKHTVACMLRKNCSALPLRLWRTACMRGAEWLHACLRELRAVTPDAEACLTVHLEKLRADKSKSGFMPDCLKGGRAGCTKVHPGKPTELPASAVPAATVLMTQAMLYEVSTVIAAVFEQGEQSKTHASSIEDVRARMLELQGSFVIVGRCQFLNTPRSAAQHFVEDSVGRDKIIDAEAHMMASEVFQALQLSDDQHSKHVQLWHAWRESTRALDKFLGDVNSALTCLLPQSEDLDLSLLTLMHASDSFEGVDGGPSDPFEVSEDPRREQRRTSGQADDRNVSAFWGAYSSVPAVSGVLYTLPEPLHMAPKTSSLRGGDSILAAEFADNPAEIAQNASVSNSVLRSFTASVQQNSPMKGRKSAISTHAKHGGAEAVKDEGCVYHQCSKFHHNDDASTFSGSTATDIAFSRQNSHSSASVHCADYACAPCSSTRVPEMVSDGFDDMNFLPSRQPWMEQAAKQQTPSQQFQNFDRGMGSMPEYSTMDDSGAFQSMFSSQKTATACDLFSPNTVFHAHWDRLDAITSPGRVGGAEGLMVGGFMGGSMGHPESAHYCVTHAQHASVDEGSGADVDADGCRSRRLLGESGAEMHKVGHAYDQLLAYSRQALASIVQSCTQLYSLTPVQHARLCSSRMRPGVPKFDYLRFQQVAAQEEKHKELFALLDWGD